MVIYLSVSDITYLMDISFNLKIKRFVTLKAISFRDVVNGTRFYLSPKKG